MKISNETKVGSLTVIAITILIIGYNFLKGKELFTNTVDYYAKYENINGIKVSNAILYNGFSVGKVTALDLNENGDVIATLTLQPNVKIPINSIAKIASQDLLGAKAIVLLFSDARTYHQEGDTLQAEVEMSLSESVNTQVLPVKAKAEKLLGTMDSILITVQTILNPNFRTLKDRADAVDGLNKEIEGWFTANPNPQKNDPDWFGLICGIHEELNDQLRKSANDANFWAEWGKPHWQTVGIALDRECSTNNKTACIQHFGTPRAIAEYARIGQIYGEMQMIKPSRLEEKLQELRARSRTYVPPPPTYTNTQQFDQDVQRSGGCFHHKSTLRTPDGTQIGYNEIVSIIESGRVVKVLSDIHGPVPIEAIVKTPMTGKTQFVQVGNTVLTPTHPILDGSTNRWFHPKALAAIYKEDVPFVFNVILGVNPDTGMRYRSVNIDGHECVGLGHGIINDPVATDSFWGTEAVVDRMKELYADQYYDYQRRTSLITFTHTLKRNPVTGWVDTIV